MANNNLEFVRTLTIEQFKGEKQINELRVKRSQKTNGLFLSWVGQGSEKGFVGGGSLERLTQPVISKVKDPESGETFWLLHNEGNGGITEATF
jgi:hypothetical protein